MRNPYIKFQKTILINFEATHGRADKPKAICPFKFSKVGGIQISLINKFRIGPVTGPRHCISPAKTNTDLGPVTGPI